MFRKSPSKRVRAAVTAFEPLENRTLMSISVSPSGGDDAVAIQNAIRGASNGTVVNFSSGNYNIRSTLSLSPNLVYQGNGATINGGGSNEVFIGNGTSTEFTGFVLNNAMLHLNNAAGLNIHNNLFENSTTGQAIILANISNSQINYNSFSNISNGTGIYGYPANGDQFDHNAFDYVYEPIHLSAVNDNTDVSYNVMKHVTNFALELQRPMSDLHVNGNYVSDWLTHIQDGHDGHLGFSLSIGGPTGGTGARNVEIGNNTILQTGPTQSNDLWAKWALEIMGGNVNIHNNYVAGWGGAFLCGNDGALSGNNNTLVNNTYYTDYSEGDSVPWSVPNAQVSGDKDYFGSNVPRRTNAPQAGASVQQSSNPTPPPTPAPTPAPVTSTTGGACQAHRRAHHPATTSRRWEPATGRTGAEAATPALSITSPRATRRSRT